jgi:hypothetical protein
MSGGNQITGAYFDEGGKPVRDNEGFARFTASYDERDNHIAGAFFDEGGKPVRDNEGLASFISSYDERGNRIAGAYFDEKGDPVRDYEGFARFTASYDKRGNCIGIEYVDGKRCLSKEGYAKATGKFDEGGHRIQVAGFDLAGNSTVKKYDLRGNEIEEAYLDETGGPRADQNGITRWTAKYSEDGNPADMTYFGQDEKPTAVEIYLKEVMLGGQAKEAGLMEGDVLVSYDGKAIRNDAQLTTWLQAPGDSLRELVVLRGRLRLTFEMKPGKMGILTQARVAQPPSDFGGNAINR